MTSIVAYTITPQTNYHIIMFVCCSLLIVIILHMLLCIVHDEPFKIDEPFERVIPIKSFETTKSHNRKKIRFKTKKSTMLTVNDCKALKRNGSPCRQDGSKSGGEIINGYCMYHKKMRK
jgi:hypothetical protein